MSKAIIFTGGGAPSRLPADLLQSGDMVIAADSGYEAAKALVFLSLFVLVISTPLNCSLRYET